MALPGWLGEEHLTKLPPSHILQILYLGPERKCQSLPGNGTLYGHDVYPTKNVTL